MSSTERMEALLAENRELQARVKDLTEEALRKHLLLQKTQERELELLRAGSLAQLIDRLVSGLKTSYQLDAVSLVLHDPQHEIRHLMSGDGFLLDSIPEVQFVDVLVSLAPQLANLERPWLGAYQRSDHELLLPKKRGLGSVALIPLRRNDQLDGVLVFASRDPNRFSRELASDFFAHLGVVAALCVENAMNRTRLFRSGVTDFLTGFHNRRYLQARLREELARAQRTAQPIACLMIDIDHFKRINDEFGHLAGDAVLREVAQRIDTEMRMSDTGARFGGDEFAIVLPQGTIEIGAKLAERVLSSVRGKPIAIRPQVEERITLSIGVASATPAQGTRDFKLLADRLIAEADAALYRAKSAGRNQVGVSENVVA